MTEERLQKILAHAGVATRRKCEEFIAAGRVTVDGKRVTEMGVKVDPDQHEICFDGRPIQPESMLYFAVNKPRGYVCTNRSFKGEKRAVDLIKGVGERLYAVGRLDKESEGLIILTNDGAFAEKLTHPRYEVPKAYHVEVNGPILQAELGRLVSGVAVEGELMRARKATLHSRSENVSRIELVLTEGRKREVRRMVEALGREVVRLVRVRIGSLKLGDIAPGQYRKLDGIEIKTLLSCAEPKKKGRRAEKAGRKRGGK